MKNKVYNDGKLLDFLLTIMYLTDVTTLFAIFYFPLQFPIFLLCILLFIRLTMEI